MTVTNRQELEELIQQVKKAQQQFANYSQEQVDLIFKKAALAANNARIPLAKMAVQETGMGVIEDKVIKNHFASEIIYNKYKQEKTCGIIEEDKSFGLQKIAEPVGILAGIVPTTNPTSTAIFKALIALKTRNGIIFSPHPRAKDCTIAAAKIVLEAAVKAGAPAGIIGWIDQPSVELSQALMQHPCINLILATGGPGMVKAAYSSGRPSLGVGAGNTPALIDETAHIKMAVSSIILSKTFDNGMICASEQSVIVVDSIYEEVRQEFIDRGAYLLSPEEREKVTEILLKDGHINPDIVGQSVEKLAAIAGIYVPEDTRLLIGEVENIGLEEPFSYEKLSPILAMYRAKDFEDGVKKAEKLVLFAGRGHTAVLYTSPSNREHIKRFEDNVETARVLINTPSSQGAIGDIYNFRLDPSLTLGCGTWGGNSISENVEPSHLLNIKTVAERRENMLWFRVPPKVYFKYGSLPIAIRELAGKKRAFIVTDKPLFDLGVTAALEEVLEEIGITVNIFYDVEPDPSLETVERGLNVINTFNPDVIIAIGGGSPMDAAKIIWLLYEHPEIEFESLAMRFMDIRKRVYELPPLGQKALMVCIPTTSGTGSEVTPFAVVTDRRNNIKYPLADYALTPSMAIVDPELVLNMPKKLTAYGGIDALTHALEAYVSVLASEYTNALAQDAIRLLFKYLPSSYHNGAKDPKAREKVHYAATMAGMAFANGFLGICHSMAHQLGAIFHIPHGLANALMISHVILYNATDAPFKQATFSQYKYPNVKWRYARIAHSLGLGGESETESVERLVLAIECLKREIGIPASIKEVIPETEAEFMAKLDHLAEQAFDDQCTGANPRYPLIEDLKTLLIQAYHGNLPLEVTVNGHGDVSLADLKLDPQPLSL
ncbi:MULTISPECIES: bifunctional acetaldehyde-CoA/alcohol dehydrogenase [unclassified Microcystis]|uniref:Aldehyde-alcohol dehydrogenase n=1 Tax=Microcystis aeruginosa Ma_QC_Ca_00000000_S207 TaxID=2486251 RepID=A0A552G259_MICAE|nr:MULTISPECIES: bifunctional acetaldehyde-CoA/alcohol dehydrogenase [unclassified Microcystis]MCA2926229.1 bifunctional acetaldehyde-CoA/alcohol dehydrogenase [Microcystis sp. M020S1]MCA2935597.1 bifunctional acetaldehyde-CoA/alcohol dehydrogenase [Microcystis sp. M015S1]TRU52977.1 MAG: bifunctional acetaldehyde-CoA/alcohol dehydrogenase [Microcystis aeruginosa Ma_QC_Ca_00000000_S207]MCA2620116.1 bifunctional acetaldehyde-CoA/alcohol dehydrogenase [Microcystis sp. M099S2]MCA2649614.1 bifuncti